MKSVQRIYLLQVLCLLVGMSALAKDHGFVGRFEMTSRGIEKILNYSLVNSANYIEKYLENYQIPDDLVKSISPAKEFCTEKKMSFLWFYQAWPQCWGLPEVFFETWSELWGRRFSHILFPRPIHIRLQNLFIRKVKVENMAAVCQASDCQVTITIQEMELTSDINLSELNSQRQFFTAHNIRLRLGDGAEKPQIHLQIHFTQDQDPQHSIQFQITGSQIQLPKKSIKLGLRDENEEFILSAAPLLGSRSIQKIPDHHQDFSSENSYEWYIFLAKLTNDYLMNWDFVNRGIQNILENSLKKPAIAAINELIQRQFIPYRVPYPNLDLQNFVDQYKIEDVAKNLHEEMIHDFVFKTEHAEQFVIKYKKRELWKLLNRTEKFMKSFNTLTWDSYNQHLKVLKDDITQVCQATLAFTQAAPSSKKGDQYIQQIKERCDQQVRQVEDISRRLLIRAQNKRSFDDYRLEKNTAISADKILSYTLATDGLGQLNKVYDIVSDDELPRHDFTIQISTDAISAYLNKMQKKGELNFCINYSDMEATCGGASEDLQVTFLSPPQLRWSSEKNKLYIDIDDVSSEIKMAPGSRTISATTTETPQIKAYLNLQPGSNGIFLNLEVEGNLKVKSRISFFRTMINQVKKMTLVHPLIAQYMIGINLEDRLETMTGSQIKIPDIYLTDQVKLPRVVFEKIISTPEFIKAYVSIDTNQ